MGTEHRGFPVRLASPCAARWSALPGGPRERRCALCGACAYELGGLGRGEAAALLGTPPERVRLYLREDGSVLTRDCPVGAGARRLRGWRRARWGAAALALLVALAVPVARLDARMREDAAVIAWLDREVEAARHPRREEPPAPRPNPDDSYTCTHSPNGRCPPGIADWIFIDEIRRGQARRREDAARLRQRECEASCALPLKLPGPRVDAGCLERCLRPPEPRLPYVGCGRMRHHQ